MIIRNVMTRNPYIISPESSVTEAKALMSKKNISKLPVVDKSNRLVGIITKNDLAKAGPSDATTLDMFEIGYLLSKLTVSKVMVKDVVTVSENEVVEEAARIMVDRQSITTRNFWRVVNHKNICMDANDFQILKWEGIMAKHRKNTYSS